MNEDKTSIILAKLNYQWLKHASTEDLYSGKEFNLFEKTSLYSG